MVQSLAVLESYANVRTWRLASASLARIPGKSPRRGSPYITIPLCRLEGTGQSDRAACLPCEALWQIEHQVRVWPTADRLKASTSPFICGSHSAGRTRLKRRV